MVASVTEPDQTIPPGPLDKALGEARLAQAAHFDAAMDIRDAQTLRLTALKDEVAAMIDGRKGARDFLELSLVQGDPPKLWLDMISYVVMAPDPRTYRLVQDRRDGHETLFETADRAKMLDYVTRFVAHRIIERERYLASGGVAVRDGPVRYGSTALILAWLSGFSLGVLVLFAAGVWLSKGP